jgi:aldehyde dehydrogenase (NAD+)
MQNPHDRLNGKTQPHGIDPSTEAVAARIALGSAADVDLALKAAQAAFENFGKSTVASRVALFERVIEEYKKRFADIAAAISLEMGDPAGFVKTAQAGIGMAHLQTALAVLKNYAFEAQRGATLLRKEPIGVCGFITPWNWPATGPSRSTPPSAPRQPNPASAAPRPATARR